MASEPLKVVVDRQLNHMPGSGSVSITDILECGHTYTRHVSNSGDRKAYNPAIRRRCAMCTGKEVN